MKIKLNLFLITFLFLFSCLPKKSKDTKQIGIQPYGNIDQEIINSIAQKLEEAYKFKVLILNKKQLPATAFINIKSPRYRADSLLRDLLINRPDSISYVIGITSKDISTTKKNRNGETKKPASKYSDWGVFGLGTVPGHSCVISTHRIKNNDSRIFKNRIQKIAIHEIGHNLGLPHCKSEHCVMQDAAESIKTIDSIGFTVCSSCFAKIN